MTDPAATPTLAEQLAVQAPVLVIILLVLLFGVWHAFHNRSRVQRMLVNGQTYKAKIVSCRRRMLSPQRFSSCPPTTRASVSRIISRASI